jgi:hypothetical protein
VRVEEAELEVIARPPSSGLVVRHSWQKHLLTFLMVFGPGLIVMEADNDAGAVSTYMQAGSMVCTCSGCSLSCCPSATSYRRWWLAWESQPARGTPQ